MSDTFARWSRAVPAEVHLLARLLGAGAALFAGSRLVLMALCADRLTGVSGLAVARAFALGTFLDLSLIAWLLLPVWMLVFLPRAHWVDRPRVRAAVSGWIGLITFLLLIGVVSDLAHFREFDVRLNGTSLDYLRQPVHLLAVLYHEFALIPVVAAMVLFSWLAARRGRRLLLRLAPTGTNGLTRVVTAGSALVGLLTLGAAAPALASSDFVTSSVWEEPRGYLVDQLTINGTSNFMEAWFAEMGDEAPLRERLQGAGRLDAEETVRGMLEGAGVEFVADAATPLWRTVDTGRPLTRPNVVLVLMESFSARGIDSLGGVFDDAPHFDALARESLVYTDHYAVGTRTNRGLAGVLSSMPALPGVSPICALEPTDRMATVADVLHDRGYNTLALCGGERGYDNLGTYLTGNGFERLIALEDFEAPQFTTEWGVSDGDLFERSLLEFDALAAENAPFFGFVLTLSNHRPYRIPEGLVAPADPDDPEGLQRAAFRYADHALGRFMDAAEQTTWYENTIFVFVADHGRHARSAESPDVESFRIPLLIHAPGRVEAGRSDRLSSQLDVAPTLLGLLGGKYESGFFGVDLGRNQDTRRAILSVGDYLAWLEADLVTVWPPHGPFETFARHPEAALLASSALRSTVPEMTRRLTSMARLAFDVSRSHSHRGTNSPEGSEAR